MAQGIFPAPTGDDFVLISSVTPTAGVNTISFTSISSYRKLALLVKSPGLSANGTINVTLNSDADSNYAVSYMTYTASTGAANSATVSSDAAGISIGGGAATATQKAHLIFDNTHTAGIKTFNGFSNYTNAGSVAVVIPGITGAYYASASVSTVTLTIVTASVNFAASGTVALYGVKI